jgi:hypothetical protein
VCSPSTASIYSSNHAQFLPPSLSPTCSITASKCTSLNLLDHCQQVCCQTCSITTSISILKVAQLWAPSTSRNSFDHHCVVHLYVYSNMGSKCISKLSPSQPPSAYHQPCLIVATKCISDFIQLSLSGESQIALHHCLPPVQIYPV